MTLFSMFYRIYKLFHKHPAKTCCYCFISLGYDPIKSHKKICFDWDYVCFTDDPKLLKKRCVGIWDIKPAIETSFDSKRNSGWHKTHPEICCAGYEYSVWIDGNVNVLTHYLYKQICNRKDKKIITPIHNLRNCIYDECDAVCVAGYEQCDIANRVKKFLSDYKMPRHYGLNETNIMFREHNDSNVLSIDHMWWKMIKNYSKRDQLSFSYVLWKHGIKPEDISINNTREDRKNFCVKNHPNHHK